MTQFGSLYDALGRELSVITKGSARFEGTLTSFSLQDSTITLENGEFFKYGLRVFDKHALCWIAPRP